MRLFKQSSLLSVSWFLGLGALLSGVGACSFAPIADVTSLAPAVKGSTISDERAYAEATDQILLTNILRARDGAPLNMGTLASMNGALSVQATLGGSFPFGADLRKIETSSGPSSAVDTFSPSLTGSTSPTYTFTPLNTEGFMLNAVQPVSAAYVLNRWNAGVSRELLMLLFAKEIDIPVARDGTHPAKGVRYLKFINNPDDKNQFAAFRQLVHVLLEAAGDLKAFDVLEPVGPTFDLYSPLNLSSQRQRLVQSMKESPAADKTGGGGTASQSGAEPKVDNSDQGGNSGLKVTIERQTQTTESLSLLHDEALFRQLNSTAFSAITSNSDGQYHFGNYTSDGTLGQMYRVYAAQVVLCVDRKSLSAKKYDIFSAAGSDTASASPAPYVPPPGLMPAHPHRMHSRHGRTSETAPPATSGDSGSTHAGVVTAPTMALVSDATKYALRAQVQFTQSGGPAGGGAPPAAAKGTGAGGNPAAAAGGGGGAAQATTAALQAQRYASIVDDTDCAPEQIVVPPRTEKEFQLQSEGFAHIQWRSIS